MEIVVIPFEIYATATILAHFQFRTRTADIGGSEKKQRQGILVLELNRVRTCSRVFEVRSFPPLHKVRQSTESYTYVTRLHTVSLRKRIGVLLDLPGLRHCLY